jgi:PPIC-type PPIASE domain/SurA-like N-terminal domain
VKPRSHLVITMSVVVALGAGLAACANGGGSAGRSPAATVAGTDITDAQVAKEASLFTFIAGLNQQTCGGAQPTDTEAVKAATCNRFALSNLIQGVFIRRYADANQITVTDQDVAGIVGTLDSHFGKDKVDQALSANGLTRDDLNALGADVLLFQDVQKKLGEAGTSDAQLQKLYQDNILEFTTVQADHILVKTKAEADQVYQQVTAPGFTDADFAALAKKVSIDPSAKQNGGALPSQPASKYVPEFGQAAAALAPGEISKPVQSQYGWHVIKLVSKSVTPFAKAKAQLISGSSSQVFNDWLVKQAQDHGVDVNPKYGRYDAPTLTVVPITSTDASASATPSAVAGSGAASPTP